MQDITVKFDDGRTSRISDLRTDVFPEESVRHQMVDRMANIRLMKLPQDIDLLVHIIREGFQYPENPEWNIEVDQIESLRASLNTLKRLWPLISGLRLFSADLRDSIHGFFYEEDGQSLGNITYMRRPGGHEWYISEVAVLPPFRRRGIARKLIDAALKVLLARRCQKVLLDVIDGNTPAYNLYKELGFEDYSGVVDYFYDQVPPKATMLDGYELSSLSKSDWRSPYELESRIVPDIIRKYTPIRESSFHRPFLMTAFAKLVSRMNGTKQEAFAIRTQSTQQVVGIASYTARVRPGGVNSITARIDPAHPGLAPFVLAHLLENVHQASLGQRIEFRLPRWQSALIEAAQAIGAKKRYEMHRMGLILEAK